MCLDIAFYSALEQIDDYFPGIIHEGDIEWDDLLGAHVMALGHKRYPVILYEDGHYTRRFFEWGIIAEYKSTPEKIKQFRKNMVNARSEKILDDPKSFWHRIRRQRCLVPVTGFYEHRAIEGWKNKVPYHIKIRNRSFFFLPALYHYNSALPSDPETGEVRGMFSLVTRAANTVMSQIHNSGDNAFRMPLLLTEEMEKKWVDQSLDDAGLRRLLNYEMPDQHIDYWPVYSIRARSPRPDGRAKTEPFTYPDLPPLGNDQGRQQGTLNLV